MKDGSCILGQNASFSYVHVRIGGILLSYREVGLGFRGRLNQDIRNDNRCHPTILIMKQPGSRIYSPKKRHFAFNDEKATHKIENCTDFAENKGRSIAETNV
jgi:hypothetical protein